MTDEPIDLQAAIREAAKRISAEVRAAIDLYVLEQGPLRLERDERGYKFVATQEIRLRLKEAEEIRADERERAAERVEALPHDYFCATNDTSYPGQRCTCPLNDAADAARGEA